MSTLEPVRDTPAGVDVGALAGYVARDAAERLAETIVVTVSRSDDEDRELTDRQLQALVSSALRTFDGFERAVASDLVAAFRRADVAFWGLPRQLEDV